MAQQLYPSLYVLETLSHTCMRTWAIMSTAALFGGLPTGNYQMFSNRKMNKIIMVYLHN